METLVQLSSLLFEILMSAFGIFTIYIFGRFAFIVAADLGQGGTFNKNKDRKAIIVFLCFVIIGVWLVYKYRFGFA